MRYIKKPIPVEAYQYTGLKSLDEMVKEWPALKEKINTIKILNMVDGYTNNAQVTIHTLEGIFDVSLGDYIICGVKGEFYSCRKDIFEMSYERVPDECGAV